MRILAPLAALGLILPAPVLAADPLPRPLTEEHKAALKCAAAFAIVAGEQEAETDASLAFPPLAYRGKRYFTDTSLKVQEETGLTKEAVRDALVAAATALQQEAAASGDPDAVMTAAAKPCLARLDAAVPPLETPGLLECSAILQVAYEDVHSREGLSDRAKDLATLASVLTGREREALQAKGLAPDAIDQTVAEAHDKLLADAFAGGPGAEKYDISHCYDLAKPDPKTHY